MTGFAKRGLVHASDFATLMSHNFVCDTLNSSMIGKSCHKISKLHVAQLQAELHLFTVEKLDSCSYKTFLRKSSHNLYVLLRTCGLLRICTYLYTICI